jgi:hypothetical protein
MNALRWASGALAGATAAIALMIACGDDSPSGADAAVCDCPAAEPPLEGRIVVISGSGDIPPNGTGGGVASCPAGAVLLGGSCAIEEAGGGAGDLLLVTAGRLPLNAIYDCEWKSTRPTMSKGAATITCLVPAP